MKTTSCSYKKTNILTQFSKNKHKQKPSEHSTVLQHVT